jgi:glucose/arabinose dehydrogenase
MSRVRRVAGPLLVTALLGAVVAPIAGSQPVAATPVQPGFQEQVVFSGLVRPTNIEFASDGRVFVAEQRGTIKIFSDLADPTATVFADLQSVVFNGWDRGLLGLALHPQFPAEPWVYVLYTYDAPPGETAPYWNDDCSTVSGGANGGRCVVTARLSKLRADGDQLVGSEEVLIRDWCQQFPSHSIGSLAFGADGALYVSSGDGASFSTVDYGQLPSGGPINPCGDPPGGTMQPPTAEGGALRSQALRSTLSNPLDLDGTVLRLDPETGAARPDNPLIGAADPNRRRVVAHGLRNPFRMIARPGTSELWIANVGWTTWEDIYVLPDPTAGPVNFGWPCYEGPNRMSGYDNANLNLCESLYANQGGRTPPFYTYNHAAKVVTGESCPTGGSSVTGLAFYPQAGGPYPAAFNGALFFADYSRQCIWVMKPATPGGPPSPARIETFVAPASGPVDLAIGPGGELYWADIGGGTIRRIRYTAGNTPPTAEIEAAPTSGPLPLAVQFDGTGSLDPDPADQDRLTYAWDFTDDGTVDATGRTASFTYQSQGTFRARLTVTDTLGATDATTVTITAGAIAPDAQITTPDPTLTWAVGQQVNFSGRATDGQGGQLPASALHWQLRMQHCSDQSNCHTHVVQEWDGVTSGSFIAPDHEYPSHLELELTAEGAGGLTDSEVRTLQPKTVNLTMASSPPGLSLTIGSVTRTAPFTQTVIQGSQQTISAPSPQTVGATSYRFGQWLHGGSQTQVITAPETATTYTASYVVTSSSVTYQAEAPGNTLGGRAVVFTQSGASGGAVVRYVGHGNANFLQFNNVIAGESLTVQVRIDYMSTTVRPATMSVNGGSPVSLSFPASGGWTTSRSLTVPVRLSAGANTIRFTHPTEWAPRFDRIVVTPSFEAEASNNTLGGQAVVVNRTNASGGKAVRLAGSGTANFVQFNNVVMARARSVQVTIYYLSTEARPATMSVNGGAPVTLDFPASGGWSTVRSLTVSAQLSAGANTIRFTHPTTWAPNIDRILVR